MTSPEQDTGFINWWEFSPVGDTFICKSSPDVSKKTTESGIIFDTKESVVMDRPWKGVVISAGPDTKYKPGQYLWWSPQAGMDLAMVRPENEGDKYILLHDDVVMGIRVKDTRK